jgi:nicotinamide-nucleotide amidase
VEGASDWFRGGVVAYQVDTKVALLGVDDDIPVVSRPMAEQMARGAAGAMHADVAVATTGAAGPTGHDGAPPGTVVLATFVDGISASVEHHYDGPPEQVVEAAAADAMVMLRDALMHPGKE